MTSNQNRSSSLTYLPCILNDSSSPYTSLEQFNIKSVTVITVVLWGATFEGNSHKPFDLEATVLMGLKMLMKGFKAPALQDTIGFPPAMWRNRFYTGLEQLILGSVLVTR